VHPSDGALAAGELTFELARALRAGVWGQGLPAPAFDDVFEVLDQRVVGERHLRLTLAREAERFEAVMFNQAAPVPARLRALYRPEVSEWNGLFGLELVIDHWEPLS
jgi:single-stranded-DNA-specific exonuclease